MKTLGRVDPFLTLYSLPQSFWPLRDAPDDDDDGGNGGDNSPPADPPPYQPPTVRELIVRHGSAERALEHHLEASAGAAQRSARREQRLKDEIKGLSGQLKTLQDDLKRVTQEKDDATKSLSTLQEQQKLDTVETLLKDTKSRDPQTLRLKLQAMGYELLPETGDDGKPILYLKKGDEKKTVTDVVNGEFFKLNPALAPDADSPLPDNKTTGKNVGAAMFEAMYPQAQQPQNQQGGNGQGS